MIYDLCVPRVLGLNFEMPLQSKPVVVGINLLQCSKQIYIEVSQHLRLWDSLWTFRTKPPALCTRYIAEVDFSLAMSGLHDLALARNQSLDLTFYITTVTPPTFGIYGLEVLQKCKSLYFLDIFLRLETGSTRSVIEGTRDLSNLLSVTGFVVRLLSHIPPSVDWLSWFLFRGPGLEDHEALRKIVDQYKFLRGSAYTPQQDTQAQGDLGKSLHSGKLPQFVLTTTITVDYEY